MTHEQLADVYEELEEDQAKKVTYILQFMWRDISSKYDLIGPYFTSSSGLYETMGAMESVGFKIKALVCDGASWNLSLVKQLSGTSGQFGQNDAESPDSEDCYKVSCSFRNPFSDEITWMIMCPSHRFSFLQNCFHVVYLFTAYLSIKQFPGWWNQGILLSGHDLRLGIH